MVVAANGRVARLDGACPWCSGSRLQILVRSAIGLLGCILLPDLSGDRALIRPAAGIGYSSSHIAWMTLSLEVREICKDTPLWSRQIPQLCLT